MGCALAKDDPAGITAFRDHGFSGSRGVISTRTMAGHGSDAKAPHLAGGMGDDVDIIARNCPDVSIQMDAEAPIWKDFFDQAVEDRQILAGQASGGFEIDGGLLAALVGLDLVTDALVLPQRRHAGALHGADVDEAVIAAVIGLDEPITLVGIEEFYGANRHDMFPFTKTEMTRRQMLAELVA